MWFAALFQIPHGSHIAGDDLQILSFSSEFGAFQRVDHVGQQPCHLPVASVQTALMDGTEEQSQLEGWLLHLALQQSLQSFWNTEMQPHEGFLLPPVQLSAQVAEGIGSFGRCSQLLFDFFHIAPNMFERSTLHGFVWLAICFQSLAGSSQSHLFVAWRRLVLWAATKQSSVKTGQCSEQTGAS